MKVISILYETLFITFNLSSFLVEDEFSLIQYSLRKHCCALSSAEIQRKMIQITYDSCSIGRVKHDELAWFGF